MLLKLCRRCPASREQSPHNSAHAADIPRFPFSQHICFPGSKIGPPEYRKAGVSVETASNDNIPAGLDGSQQSALERILTKRLALVQGPPGTGKTFLSVAALKVLLESNKGLDTPIIVASQTNHALDQLLTLIAKFEPNFVRLGNQTEDPKILERSIFELRKSMGKPYSALASGLLTTQKQLQAQLKEITAPLKQDAPMVPEYFRQSNLISDRFLESFNQLQNEWVGDNVATDPSPIERWCGPGLKRFTTKAVSPTSGTSSGDDDDDVSDDGRPGELDLEIDRDEEQWENLRGVHIPFHPGFVAGEGESFSTADAARLLAQAKDASNIPIHLRGRLYNHLQHSVKSAVSKKLTHLDRICKQLALDWKAHAMQTDNARLGECRVIGVTLTGLSKYRPLLMSLNPKVVLLEEAAEALEPHSLVACMPSVEHLVMVGDHMQLRGHVNSSLLEKLPFQFNRSLFERLVVAGLENSVLGVQRRMRPEVRQLIKPIYPSLEDHPSVRAHPAVNGVQHSLFFYEHQFQESSDASSSRLNAGEAQSIALFAKYLLDNGYAPDKITILTFYSAQKKYLTKRLAGHVATHGLRHSVRTVDSFQGEENDIIILSLVRNNSYREIGFLADMNRVNVSLSRARFGLFIFGNTCGLSEGNYLWRQALYVLINSRRVFNYLPLICSNHGHILKGIAEVDMGRLNGGCDYPCKTKLECGHVCEKRCHPYPHSAVGCQRDCLTILPCGHTCQNRCFVKKHQCATCPSLREEGPTVFFERPSQTEVGKKVAPVKGASISPPVILTVDERLRSLPQTTWAEKFRAYAKGGAREDDRRIMQEARSQGATRLEEVARGLVQKAGSTPPDLVAPNMPGISTSKNAANGSGCRRDLPMSHSAPPQEDLIDLSVTEEKPEGSTQLLEQPVPSSTPATPPVPGTQSDSPSPDSRDVSNSPARRHVDESDALVLTPTPSSEDGVGLRNASRKGREVADDGMPGSPIVAIVRHVVDRERGLARANVSCLIDLDEEDFPALSVPAPSQSAASTVTAPSAPAQLLFTHAEATASEPSSSETSPGRRRRIWTQQYTSAVLDRRVKEIQRLDAPKSAESSQARVSADNSLFDLLS